MQNRRTAELQSLVVARGLEWLVLLFLLLPGHQVFKDIAEEVLHNCGRLLSVESWRKDLFFVDA